MAQFLTTTKISAWIEEIIMRSQGKVCLVSPFLKLSNTLFERLQDADRKGVKIVIVYGKKAINSREEAKLAQLKHLTTCFHPNLHAKCYFNESDMVITSMNMYEFSEKNNREMGVHISREKNPKVFTRAYQETVSIIRAAQRIPLSATAENSSEPQAKEKQSTYSTPSRQSKVSGYCIRCGNTVTLNSDRPYCYKCYRVWARYKNTNYEENFCHTCRGQEPTTMKTPLCAKCAS